MTMKQHLKNSLTSVANLIKNNIKLQCEQQMNPGSTAAAASADVPTTSGTNNAKTKTKPISDKPCKCKGICVSDGRCNCFKQGKKCTNQCHEGALTISCQNKDATTKSRKGTKK